MDREGTLAWKAFAEGVLGDILPVVIKNNSLAWHAALCAKVVRLMGLEQMMYAMVDEPDELRALMAYLRDNLLAYAKWQEHEGLLILNNGNDYAGAGSYGFTTSCRPSNTSKRARSRRTTCGSTSTRRRRSASRRACTAEFVFPYYRDLCEPFGLVYYGCCEPVHDIWEDYVSELPHLRKVSISAWCNEEFMGERAARQPGDLLAQAQPELRRRRHDVRRGGLPRAHRARRCVRRGAARRDHLPRHLHRLRRPDQAGPGRQDHTRNN